MNTSLPLSKTTVLDHGYIQLVEAWGSDEGIVEAARMSTNKGFKGWGTDEMKDCAECKGEGGWCFGNRGEDWSDCDKCHGSGKVRANVGDEKLLSYLYKNKHSTPFEMAGLTIEVKAPIFVFRQWHRHRTQSYNEMSARYTPLPNENYIPTVDRLLVNSKKNKQAGVAKGSEELTQAGADSFREALAVQYAEAEMLYQEALRLGVPKELARVHLPVARYSRMRASANLRNWLAFMTLRSHSHAQHEIRVYAEALGSLIADKFPRTWELFSEGHKG